MKSSLEAGIAVRRQVRDYFYRLGIDFVEDKHFFSSTFYFDKKLGERVNRDIEAWQKELDSLK